MHFFAQNIYLLLDQRSFSRKMLFGNNTLSNKETSPVLTKQLTQLLWKASYVRMLYAKSCAQKGLVEPLETDLSNVAFILRYSVLPTFSIDTPIW